ncbi:phosphoribulokinase [Microbulbifer marinus]|uniref:Glycerate kinase n=1 Tax=Microbulbifer marinus TaxID=658218 RepID=A0A1H4ANL2_9GAMM|nr:phosphoribulokinase [Microbulbifer marinus]SEA37483.1 glycerate kinase [Microbulbifer marinus]
MTDTWPKPVTDSAAELSARLRPHIDQFIRTHQLPDTFDQLIGQYYLPLAIWLAEKHRQGRTLVVGICGGQGSGKSTLTAFLQLVWAQMDLRSAGFSLDDIYLTKAERRELARRVHPLLQTRGVPGTHDVQLGMDTITALCDGTAGSETPIPQFDKSIDDRVSRANWPVHRGTVDILLFEGWCVGARPWRDADAPINALERQEDADGIWRNYINAQLAGPYRDLFARLDVLLMLKVPDMDCVLEWRQLQEHKLRARSGGGMTDDELERFVQHYERITRNLLAEMPARADCVFELGRDHQIERLRLNDARRAP